MKSDPKHRRPAAPANRRRPIRLGTDEPQRRARALRAPRADRLESGAA